MYTNKESGGTAMSKIYFERLNKGQPMNELPEKEEGSQAIIDRVRKGLNNMFWLNQNS